MSELFGLSFDAPASLEIAFERSMASDHASSGWFELSPSERLVARRGAIAHGPEIEGRRSRSVPAVIGQARMVAAAPGAMRGKHGVSRRLAVLHETPRTGARPAPITSGSQLVATTATPRRPPV